RARMVIAPQAQTIGKIGRLLRAATILLSPVDGVGCATTVAAGVAREVIGNVRVASTDGLTKLNTLSGLGIAIGINNRATTNRPSTYRKLLKAALRNTTAATNA